MTGGRSGGGLAAVACVFILVLAGTNVTVAWPQTGDVSPAPRGPVGHERVPTADTRPDGSGTSETAAPDDSTINLVRELHLTPDRPGEITVTVRYARPARVTSLRTRVPAEATVVSTRGFVQRDPSRLEWDEEVTTPSITYRLTVNETREASGTVAGQGDFVFVDPGPWALVRVPSVVTEWRWTGSGRVDISRTTTVAGAGAVGETMAFLGPHRSVSRTVHGQTFRLIVPERATLAEPPDEIFDALAAASDSLRVGDRDDRVFAVAAPNEAIRWAYHGYQVGDSDFWVRDDERLDTADNIWLHEYVHTRQDYRVASDVRWFTEASATYYAALLALEQGRIGFEEFHARLGYGTRDRDARAVLEAPETWSGNEPYTKGALVTGEQDRRLRVATDQHGSLQEVFRWMNSHPDVVTAAAFKRQIRSVGDDTSAEPVEKYATMEGAPSTWGQRTHERAFGPTPARMSYVLPGPETERRYRVRGPYRTAAVDGAPLRLVVGETLVVPVRVTNAGGTAGEYDPALFADGRPVARRNGTLDPGESTTLEFTRRFREAGEYTLSVGGAEFVVSVREPATPVVTGLSATRSPGRGETISVTVTATAANDRGVPAVRNLTLTADGRPVATRRVSLGPNERRTVTYEDVGVSEPGVVFRVGDRATVATAANESRVPADGFGVLPALLAVGSLLLLLRRGRP